MFLWINKDASSSSLSNERGCPGEGSKVSSLWSHAQKVTRARKKQDRLQRRRLSEPAPGFSIRASPAEHSPRPLSPPTRDSRFDSFSVFPVAPDYQGLSQQHLESQLMTVQPSYRDCERTTALRKERGPFQSRPALNDDPHAKQRIHRPRRLSSTVQWHHASATYHRGRVHAQSVKRSPTLHVCWSYEEQRGLHFYLNTLACEMGVQHSDQIFWQNVVPSMAESSHPIRQIVTAIALLQEKLHKSSNDTTPVLYIQSLKQCNRAIAQIRKLAGNLPSETLLVSSVLLACWNILRRDFTGTRKCVEAGLSMSHKSIQQALDFKRECAQPVGTDTSQNSDAAKRAIYSMVAKLVIEANRHSWAPGNERLAVSSATCIHGPFERLSHISVAVDKLANATFSLAKTLSGTSHIDPGSRIALQLVCQFADFEFWFGEFKLRERHLSSLRAAKLQEYQIYFLISYIVFHCSVLDCGEMAYDRVIDRFREMVDVCKAFLAANHHSEFVVWPFNAMTVPGLWLVGTRCREPNIRREAIHLLRNYRRREAGFDSVMAGKISQHLMQIEEQRMVVGSCSDISESSRVTFEGIAYNAQKGKAQLRYMSQGRIRRSDEDEWLESKAESWLRIDSEHRDGERVYGKYAGVPWVPGEGTEIDPCEIVLDEDCQ